MNNDLSRMNIVDVASLAESVEVECKAAQGRGGKGEVPDSFWASYSALANTQGGKIFLGIEEKPKGRFRALGIVDIDRIRKAVWDNLHNRKQVNLNLLREADVQAVLVEEKQVLLIHVPRATRQQKPIHLGTNPFGGTYVRRHEGDYSADDETVRRMLAERIEDARDDRVLEGYSFSDLDMDTVAAYRNRFSAVKPGHVWLDLPIKEFLEKIGAIGKDRERGVSGVRLAGLLMFGRFEAIRDALPNYMVDYQERPEPRAERRWVDRLIPDGTWSGNIYDFYRRVYQKLTDGLKVPFHLKKGQRVEDTPVHEALREALVNTLIHADFSGRVSVLVVKRPDMFGFRNPGQMRIPVEMAVVGGNSDCRNRRLQTMFLLVGYGDHAGSGIPKIYRNWESEHWRRPLLYELADPEQTLMQLRMLSLLPDEVVNSLAKRFGDRFRTLPELERLAMVTAATEQTINHARLKEICSDHAADITKALIGLVKEGLLDSDGVGKGTVYFLPGADIVRPADVFTAGSIGLAGAKTATEVSSIDNSEGLLPTSEGLPASSAGLPLTSEGLRKLCNDIIREQFGSEALPGKLPKPAMRSLIQKLCSGRFVQLRTLAEVLGRSPDFLRQAYLNPMVKERLLELRYPTTPNHQDQAYRTAGT